MDNGFNDLRGLRATLRLGTDYFVLNPACYQPKISNDWAQGKLALPLTPLIIHYSDIKIPGYLEMLKQIFEWHLAVYGKFIAKIIYSDPVDITIEEIHGGVNPKEKDIEIISDEKIYAGVDFGNDKDRGQLLLMSYNGERVAVIKSVKLEITKEPDKREFLKYLQKQSISSCNIAKGEMLFHIKPEEVDNLREIAFVNGKIVDAIDSPYRMVTKRDKPKQNFRDVLPKKSRKRKEWK